MESLSLPYEIDKANTYDTITLNSFLRLILRLKCSIRVVSLSVYFIPPRVIDVIISIHEKLGETVQGSSAEISMPCSN